MLTEYNKYNLLVDNVYESIKNGDLDFYSVFDDVIFSDYDFSLDDKAHIIEVSFKRLEDNLSFLTDERKKTLISLKLNNIINNSNRDSDRLKALQLFIDIYSIDKIKEEEDIEFYFEEDKDDDKEIKNPSKK